MFNLGGGGGNRTPRDRLTAANGFEVRKAHQSLSASGGYYIIRHFLPVKTK
jgi:hypothetical protein